MSGRVIEQDNQQGLPGATVLVKGMPTGTSTNVNGQCSRAVPDGATLQFSMIGMKTQDVPMLAKIYPERNRAVGWLPGTQPRLRRE